MNRCVLVADDNPEGLIYKPDLFGSGVALDFSVRSFSSTEALLKHFSNEYKTGRRVPLCILALNSVAVAFETAQKLHQIDARVFIIAARPEGISQESLTMFAQELFFLASPFQAGELFLLVQTLLKAWERREGNPFASKAPAKNEPEEWLRVIFDNSPVGMLMADAQGMITQINASFLEIAGVPGQPEKVIGKLSVLNNPIYIQAGIQSYFDRLYKNGEPFTLEAQLKSSFGKENYLLYIAVPLVDEKGAVTGCIVNAEDISKRKSTEKALAEQRTLAEALRDSAEALTRTLDIDEVFDLILTNVGKVVTHEAANITLIDKQGITYTERARGYPPDCLQVVYNTHLVALETPNMRRIILEKIPICTPDGSNDPDWMPVPGLEWIQSHISAPIVIQGDVVGFLNLDSHQLDFFSSNELDGLNAFAGTAAIAIHNARLYSEVHQSAREVAALRDAGLAVNASLDYEQVLNNILAQIDSVITCDCASVVMVDGDEIVVRAVRGFENPQDMIGLRFSLINASPNQRVLESSSPVIVPDIQKDYPLFAKDEHTRSFRSWMGIPLVVRQRIVGMLNLDSKELDHFTAGDERLAVAFAAQVAVALENSSLYSDAQRRITEQSILNEIIQSVSANLAFDDFFVLVDKQINRFIDTEFFMVVSYDEENDEWTPIYLKNPVGDLEHRNYKTSEGLVGYVIKNRQALFLNSEAEIDDFSRLTGRQNLGFFPKAIMAVPLVIADQVVGAMMIENAQRENFFSPNDYSLFTTIGAQIGVAFANARLFEKLQKLAITDSLTGLFNRHHFFSLAEKEVDRAGRYTKPLSLIMIDLDNFKQVNDTFGHMTGDEVLRIAAHQLSRALRKIDIAGRYGGEEFVVVLPETNVENAYSVAERLRQTIASAQVKTSAGDVRVTASLGIANLDEKHTTLAGLLDAADRAMYIAKHSGRNQVVIYNPGYEKLQIP